MLVEKIDFTRSFGRISVDWSITLLRSFNNYRVSGVEVFLQRSNTKWW